jgi:N-acetylneuraminic acid mutarotase
MFLFTEKNRRIKAIAYISLFIVSIFILSKCQKENARPRSYPRVNTMAVSNITEKGATFNAEIYSLGSEAIINHGFAWGVGSQPAVNYYNKILLGPYETTGTYSAEVFTTLKKDVNYTVRPFLQTAEHIVYGIPVTFKSLGSGAPVIYGFKPDSAAWMDTLVVRGKHFSWIKQENIVKFNNVNCNTIASTDTTLSILVDYYLTDLKSVLSVELAGNVTVYIKDTLKLKPPLITDFYPKKARWNDTIYIKGRSLKTISYKPGNYVKLGGFNCPYIRSFGDSTISVKVPDEITTVSNSMTMLLNGFNLFGKDQFQLLSPYFTFSPVEGTWGNTLSLTGMFNTIASRNSVYFDDVQATILWNSASLLKVQVPADLSKVKTNIIYKASPFTITSTDTFHLKSPVIRTFAPSSGPGNTVVLINGKYFSNGNTVVNFGTTPGVIQSMNDSTINVKVPSGINGPVKISITVKMQTVISSTDFNVTNPKINSVFPLSGTFNDEVTVTGENFITTTGNTTVSFGGIPAAIKSLTATSATVKVPLTMDSIPRALYVGVGPNNSSSIDKFTLNPPQITSISPGSIAPSQDITIVGTNFNPVPANNYVSWDIYLLTVKSATPTEIVATLPNALPRANYKIKINTGGYSRFSSQSFSINSQWSRIPAPSLSTNGIGVTTYGGMTIYGEAPGNFGYLCSPASNVMYRFDPSNKSWTNLNTSTPFYMKVKMGEVVCKGIFYLISGFEYSGISSTMYAFNEISNDWETINIPFNRRTGVAFSLNNRIYFGLSYRPWNYLAIDLWECDPENNYSWTRKSDIPDDFNSTYSTYFSLNNKGYVLFSNNHFWQYDPSSDVWIRKSDFPGPKRELGISFVIDEFAYFGTGISESTNYNDIWKYDQVSDSWTLNSYMPTARNSAVAFTLNHKAYIGYGVTSDFYEFDPNYLLK